MRTIGLFCATILLSGCALFEGGGEPSSAALTAPAPGPRAAFQPAFAVGAPAALMPCRKSRNAFSGTCRAGDRHEAPGGAPEADGASLPLTEAASPLARE